MVATGGPTARRTVVEQYVLPSVCLPRRLELFEAWKPALAQRSFLSVERGSPRVTAYADQLKAPGKTANVLADCWRVVLRVWR